MAIACALILRAALAGALVLPLVNTDTRSRERDWS